MVPNLGDRMISSWLVTHDTAVAHLDLGWAGTHRIISSHNLHFLMRLGCGGAQETRSRQTARDRNILPSHGPGLSFTSPILTPPHTASDMEYSQSINTFWCHSRMILRRFVTEWTSKSRCCNVSWSPVRVWSEHSGWDSPLIVPRWWYSSLGCSGVQTCSSAENRNHSLCLVTPGGPHGRSAFKYPVSNAGDRDEMWGDTANCQTGVTCEPGADQTQPCHTLVTPPHCIPQYRGAKLQWSQLQARSCQSAAAWSSALSTSLPLHRL